MSVGHLLMPQGWRRGEGGCKRYTGGGGMGEIWRREAGGEDMKEVGRTKGGVRVE